MSQVQTKIVRPHVDIFENDAEILLIGDVPGVQKEQLELQLEKGRLSLEAKTADAGVLYSRSFLVPEAIDRGQIAAELEDGVLRVHLPKRESERARRVEIKTPLPTP